MVLIEHDLDGDPATRGDLLQTIYERVDPLVSVGDIVSQGQVIAHTKALQGEHLHFGVRRAPFDPADRDVYRNILPPPGTMGCVPCYGRPLSVPAFPEHWEDPAHLLRSPSDWAELLEAGEEGGGDVVEMPDGYLLGGWTRAANIGGSGNSDMWLVRLDPEGRIVSQRAYGGPGVDEIRRLLPAADGGYLALARSGSFGPGRNSPMLVKFDAAAEQIEWQAVYVSSGSDWGNDLRPTSDGGYVMAGATDPCACDGRHRATVIKLDGRGAVQWAKSYQSFAAGLPSTDAVSIAEIPDGGYVVAGSVAPGTFGASDLVVFRLDATGHPIWSSIIGAVAVDVPGQIEVSSDGGVVIVGTRGIAGGLKGLWLLKLRSDGSLERETLYTTFGQDTGTRMVPMPDGGYVLAGHTLRLRSSTGRPRPDLWLMKLDATGQVVQQRTYDSRGAFDDVTGLRPTRDGGFILTGGQDNSCSLCTPDFPSSNFLVVKTNADLEVSRHCETEAGAVQFSRVSSFTQASLAEEMLAVGASPTNVLTSDTGARVYPCDEGSYGPPPVFQSASVQSAESSVACDFTRLIEAVVCTFGAPGVEATMPVILSGTYDEIEIDARVTDEDSTPERSDIAQVLASIAQPGESFLIPVPLLDDGSAQVVLENQKSNSFGEDCFNDPIHGVCSCLQARYPTSSGDFVTGDSVYTHRDALINLNQSPLLADCVMSSRHRTTRWFPASTSLDVSLQATDRLGNTSAWPVPIQVTTGINSLACSGDACGCCLLLAFDRQTGVEQCAGLDGMPSPQFPCGLCVGIFAGSCPP